MQAKADSIGQCMDVLFSPPKKDEAMPDAHEDMCSAKGSGKGRPLRVPQLGEEDGPKWMYGGGIDGWKVLIGHLPSNISEAAIWPLLRRASAHIRLEPQPAVTHCLCARHLL